MCVCLTIIVVLPNHYLIGDRRTKTHKAILLFILFFFLLLFCLVFVTYFSVIRVLCLGTHSWWSSGDHIWCWGSTPASCWTSHVKGKLSSHYSISLAPPQSLLFNVKVWPSIYHYSFHGPVWGEFQLNNNSKNEPQGKKIENLFEI